MAPISFSFYSALSQMWTGTRAVYFFRCTTYIYVYKQYKFFNMSNRNNIVIPILSWLYIYNSLAVYWSTFLLQLFIL